MRSFCFSCHAPHTQARRTPTASSATMELAAAKGLLQEAAAFYARLPLPLLVAGHSLTVCAWFKRAHGSRYLLNYWVAFLAAFGGGMASAIIIQVRRAWLAPAAWGWQ